MTHSPVFSSFSIDFLDVFSVFKISTVPTSYYESSKILLEYYLQHKL